MEKALPERMKALVAYGPSDYRLEMNWPVPECGSNDIIIKTEGCGICSSDLKCLHGAPQYWGSEEQKAWVDPPFIPGHEFLGYIAALGEHVKGYSIGDRITCDQIAPCGECRFCKSGKYWMCQPHRMYGYFKDYCGGMAEYVRIRTKHFGADLVWNPNKMDVVKAIMDMTDGYGCDIYIEATGHPSAVTQGMQMIRKLGTFVEFSVFAQPTTLDWSIIGDKKELNVLGSHISPYTYPFIIENMASGNLKTDGVVTKTFPLDEWETAFHYAAGKDGDIKVAFRF